jgi:hypothetical protein
MIRMSLKMTVLFFCVTGFVMAQTGFEETFNSPVDLTFWRPHTGLKADNITPIFAVSQEDSTLKVVMKQNSFSDGQFYDFTKLGDMFDLTQYPYASIKIRVAPGLKYGTRVFKAIPFSLSPWSGLPPTGIRMHSNATVSVKADSLWHECLFDWRKADTDPGTYPNDYSMIMALLLETVQWPDTFSATFWLDDFRIGDKVILSSVDDRAGSNRPDGFSLSQNYPNPFNPGTRIAYRLQRESRVKLTVLDPAGKTVATLVDGRQSAGPHEARFEAGRFASGVYVYRLEAGAFSETRRMVMIR